MALPVQAAIAVLQTLLPIAERLIDSINQIKEDNPEAWEQVRGNWDNAVSKWRQLDE